MARLFESIRRNKVNPVETLNPSENRWDDRDAKSITTITTTPSGTNSITATTITPSISSSSSISSTSTITSNTTTTITSPPSAIITDQPRSSLEHQLPDVSRKSSRAKRVKSYLKRCKQAALGGGGGSGGSSKPQMTAEDPVIYHDLPDKIILTQFRSRSLSRRRGQEVLGSTYWYVDDELEEDTVEVHQSVTTQTEQLDKEIIEIVDSRTEGGTVIVELNDEQVNEIEQNEKDIVINNNKKHKSTNTGVEREQQNEEEIVEGKDQITENTEETQITIPTQVKGATDVATLVERHLGVHYANFVETREALVRQARDLLVCTFLGDLAAFEKDFCIPAAAVLARAKAIPGKGCDAVSPRGWPLSLGRRGLLVHLGEVALGPLAGCRRGARDAYLCVAGRGSQLSLRLVLRRSPAAAPEARDLILAHTPHIKMDAASAAAWLESPLALELSCDGQENLSGLLHTLLVGVERAMERVPLDELAFPCPCRLACRCQGDGMTSGGVVVAALSSPPPPPETRDSCIQTSPMFEFVGSLPHIDSDDGSVEDTIDVGVTETDTCPPDPPPEPPTHPPPPLDDENDIGILPPGKQNRDTQTVSEPESLSVPRSVADLPERLRMSNIYLPGTHDLRQRPLILFDANQVANEKLTDQEIATLLLYYATIPSVDEMVHGITILITGNVTATNLDNAIVLIKDRVKFSNALLWQPDTEPKRPSVIAKTVFARSKLRVTLITSEVDLREWIAEDQTPTTCGGPCSHDQLEWVEFQKEYEAVSGLCQKCGRGLARALAEVRRDSDDATSTLDASAAHRIIIRALADPELRRARREAPPAIERLVERAHWLPASTHVRARVDSARRLAEEVERVARRLSTLCDGRRERLRELARARALEDESTQVLSWLSQKGEETLRRHSELATNLPAIKQQEHDFEHFYFISMRHLDKGSDLVEAAAGVVDSNTMSTTTTATATTTITPGRPGGLRELARTLKHHLRGFSERLEDTRERLEDTSRCFYLLDKAYEWSLETGKYMSRMKADETHSPEQQLQLLKHLQQHLMAHPPPSNEHFNEMSQLAAKLNNPKLIDQSKIAQNRCQETIESIAAQQTRFIQSTGGGEWAAGIQACSTPGLEAVGRRRSLAALPYIYKCSHHAAGDSTCACWDADECHCRLGDIQEVRESAEDLLEQQQQSQQQTNDPTNIHGPCARCGKKQSCLRKRHLRRSSTWQYQSEPLDETTSSTDTSADNTTEGSEGTPKNDDLEDTDSQMTSSKPVPPVPVNSHLHCHPSSLDLAGTQKSHKTLLLIMREMIQTERDYVKSLEYIIENYIPELLREDIPQALRGQRNVIFGNVEKIYEFHSQYFLQELERCENSPLLVGQCFLRHEKKFYLYALYNKNKPKSDSLMSEYGTNFFKAKQLELEDKMDLASYLLKPVQRMGKYALLLQQLMKAAPDKEADVAEIVAAEKMVRFQLRHGNDLLAMDSLRDCDVNVKEQGRLLRQNEFLVSQGKGKAKKCLRQVFLFEELILFSKARRFPDRKNLDLYIYKNSIKMTDIGLTAKIGDSPTKFEIWFRKRKPNDTFTLQSVSEEIKHAWTEEISKLLWKQALKNREMRLAEMSSMGIGNKPCLDIRPSADQISDRSISIAQLSKTAPRFRNSINVSPTELLRTNKRPHSIISVSSSSSSGGSSASAYGGTSNIGSATSGACSTNTSSSAGSSTSSSNNNGHQGPLINLGYDPADSPRLHHRSTTLHSQCSMESGIIADISLGSEDTDGSGGGSGGLGGHNSWAVERSNSSVTSTSLDSTSSPILSPTEELKLPTLNHHQLQQEELQQSEQQEDRHVCVKL